MYDDVLATTQAEKHVHLSNVPTSQRPNGVLNTVSDVLNKEPQFAHLPPRTLVSDHGHLY